MSKYSVPENIRKMKPKNTMVKKIGDKYYAYEFEMYYDSNKKRKVKMGKSVGKIDPTLGFIPNVNNLTNDEITILEFGQYYLVYELTKHILINLNNFFGIEDSLRIYLSSLFHVVNNFVPTRDLPEYFQQSFFSELFPNLSFGINKLSEMLENLGKRTERSDSYIQNLINDAETVAIDGHCIRSSSKENDLTDFGIKYSTFHDKQVNLLMAYNVDTLEPIYSDFFNGSFVDKTSLKDTLSRFYFKNTLFILDNGFYSEENLELLSQNNNAFIIPLSRSFKIYKEAIKETKYTNVFKYSKGKKNTVINWYEFKGSENFSLPKNRKVFVYLDTQQNLNEIESYVSNLEKGFEGFSYEKFEELKKYFGLVVLCTSKNTDAKTVFNLYKKRWTIETFYNAIDNSMNFNSFGFQDFYKMKGLSFLILISGQIYSELSKFSKRIPGYSIDEILLKCRMIKVKKQNNEYVTFNKKKSIIDLLADVGIKIVMKLDEITPLKDLLPKN